MQCAQKSNKSLSGKGQAALLREWPAIPFPPQDSVGRVYLSIAATTQDPAGGHPHQRSTSMHYVLWERCNYLDVVINSMFIISSKRK